MDSLGFVLPAQASDNYKLSHIRRSTTFLGIESIVFENQVFSAKEAKTLLDTLEIQNYTLKKDKTVLYITKKF